MRTHGSVEAVPGAGPADHLCWVYEDDVAFDEAAHAFLAGGLAGGARLLCIGERVIESLKAPGGPDLSDLIAAGTIETLTLAEAYEAAGQFLPDQQLAYYDHATRRAHEAGYRGLRVIAEVSSLAADPAQRADLIRWEQIADRFVARGSGFSAMCAYRADLGPEALADVASVHPLVHAADDASSFRLFADGDRLVLVGSVDTFSGDRLSRVLAAASVTDEVVVLDLAKLDFIDVGASRALARWTAALAERSVAVQLIGATELLRRMWHVLGFDRVAQVQFVEAIA